MNEGKAKAAGPITGEEAWSYVLLLLSRRAYTAAQLREKLARKGAKPADIDSAIARLEHYRLIDDEAYAEAYVRGHSGRKGKLALRQELIRRGVPEGISEAVLEPLDESGQTESAYLLLSKNAWRFRKGEGRRARARAFSFLARRGYTGDVVVAALERCDWLGNGEVEEDGE